MTRDGLFTPHSTWAGEAKARAAAMAEDQATIERLRARVEALEATLGDMLGRWELYCGGPDNPHGGRTDGKLMEQARAALEATTQPHSKPHSAKSVPPRG